MSDTYTAIEDIIADGSYTVWQCVTDSAGNWYKIPSDMYDEFILLDDDEYKELDFLKMFEPYAVTEDDAAVKYYKKFYEVLGGKSSD